MTTKPPKRKPSPKSREAKKTSSNSAPAPAKKRIFLVDDHPLLRRGIADVINDEPDMIVCGQAGSAAEALACIAATQPDLVVADISLPGRDGFELIKDLKTQFRHAFVLVLSMHDESLYAERVLRAGARGYVMKSAPTSELLKAIRQVLSGEVVVGPKVIGRLLARTATGTGNGVTSPLECLTDRELEVYRLLGQGQQRHQIATQLHLSVKTVEAHRENVRKKLGLPSAAELRQHASEFLREEAAGISRS